MRFTKQGSQIQPSTHHDPFDKATHACLAEARETGEGGRPVR
jgi:hypothetical protein